MLDRVKFFRRRQYVLGPEHLNYKGWRHLKIDEKFLLTIHPDLTTTILENGNNKAVLLGYAIDPYQPELEDEDILQQFVSGPISVVDIISGLEKLSGRFVLIVKCHEGLWLFPDACALRQINYCFDRNGAIWCASQAETLAEHFGFEYDKEVLSYRNCPAYSDSKEDFWLINDRTPYRKIKYLLANHYLDLLNGSVKRFWPVSGSIGSLSLDESSKLCSPILQHSIKAAVKRFDLKMAITAGSDSRRSLAASKDVSNKIYFFTHTPQSDSADMKIPARLLPRLGINHHKHDLQPMGDEFRKYYEINASWARQRYGNIAYTALKYFGTEVTVLISDRSEIHECWTWLPKSKINGEGLADAKELNHFFAISEFQKWMDDAQAACVASKMNILVLYDLELRSRWVAASYSEYDIAFETFCPYNNRHLFSLELSINERYRRSRQLTFLKKNMYYMWPEVLIEPINPPDRVIEKVEKFLLESLIHKTITPYFPVYDYLRYLKSKLLSKYKLMVKK